MIYYLDCEFDGFRGPLISLAFITMLAVVGVAEGIGGIRK